MTTACLAEDLRRDEGLKLEAYPDPLTRAEPWTIGYGHTGPGVEEGLVWTLAQAEAALEADIVHACRLLDALIPWWRTLDDPRQDVLAQMMFNMGWRSRDGAHGLATFSRMLAAARAGDWPAAHDQMLASGWAREVGPRARRLALQMLTGASAGEPVMEPAAEPAAA
jgi:lysozyme